VSEPSVSDPSVSEPSVSEIAVSEARAREGCLAVIGCGLMGGSVARALRRARAVEEIVGYSPDPEERALAVALGVLDRAAETAAAAVAGAGIVVIAVPVPEIGAVLAEIAPALGSEAVVTDLGSVKGEVVTAARAALGPAFAQFVPGHPIAGLEKSGVAASRADLFAGRRVILTPVAETRGRAVLQVTSLWEAMGAEVDLLTPERHDLLLAATSHLPHLVAYALVDTVRRQLIASEIAQYAGPGFADTTRIAASPPGLWRDIALANREALVAVLRRFEETIHALGDALEAGDGEQLQRTFQAAQEARVRLGNAAVGIDAQGQ